MIRPLGPRLLIKRLDEAPSQVAGSLIFIPETIEAKPSAFALVLAIGKLIQGGIVPGDVVILKDYAGCPVYEKLDGPGGPETECALVVEEDVLAVVEGVGL